MIIFILRGGGVGTYHFKKRYIGSEKNITVIDGTLEKSIKSGGGDDTITIKHSEIEGINTGDGDDTIRLEDVNSNNRVISDNYLFYTLGGDDKVFIIDSDIKLNTGEGRDYIEIIAGDNNGEVNTITLVDYDKRKDKITLRNFENIENIEDFETLYNTDNFTLVRGDLKIQLNNANILIFEDTADLTFDLTSFNTILSSLGGADNFDFI